MQRDTDVAPTVLEWKHVLNFRAPGQLRVAIGPDVNEQFQVPQRQSRKTGKWILLKTTTSHTPRPAAVGTPSSGGCWALAVNVGNRLSKTATSHEPVGTSVGFCGSQLGARGLYSGGGRNVRCCRWLAYATHSPRRGCQRRWVDPVVAGPGGAGAHNPSGTRPRAYNVSDRPSFLINTRRCKTSVFMPPRNEAPVHPVIRNRRPLRACCATTSTATLT